jgi:hypothetical protein
MRGGANHQLSILTPQRYMRRPQPVRRLSSTLHPSGQMPAKQRGTARRWQVTQWPTSRPKSTIAVVEKMAKSPSSADARGVGISRAAILKKISTLTRRHVGVHPHVRRIPLAPRELRGGGVHGAGATPADGGIAAQVPAPPALWVKYGFIARGLTAPRKRRLPAHHKTGQGGVLLQRPPVGSLSAPCA